LSIPVRALTDLVMSQLMKATITNATGTR
jgi:hypothetical protein